MNRESMLTGLGTGECVDPNGDVQLLAELACSDEDICRALQEAMVSQSCQVEWQAAGRDFNLYVLADQGADQDQILAALVGFLDNRPNKLHLIETRLVQRPPVVLPGHGFRFVRSNASGPKDIILAAGSHAFGSGDHPSTNLVIELLEELSEIPSPVLDVGCGTGVLSIIAARLGARQVVGLDIDDEAVMVASVNAQANNLADRLSFTTSSLQEIGGSFALILANLTASVLYRLMSALTRKAELGSRLIISGLQGRQGDEAEELAARQGWHLEERRALGKWQALLFVMLAKE